MRSMTTRNRIAVLLLACAAGAGLACGDGDLAAASAELEQLEGQVAQARELVERSDAAATEAGEALELARAELEEAEQQLADARQRVEKATNDATLFRAVQQRLLDERDLEGVAISALVQRRTVTLVGSVPNETLKKRAEEIAAGTRGVQTVVNQITIDVAASVPAPAR